MGKRAVEFGDALKQIWHSIRGQENKPSLASVKEELLLELEARGLLSKRSQDADSNPLDYWDRGNVPNDAIVDFFAEVGIQRAKLDGKWLDRFLRAAGYSQLLRQERAATLLQYSDRLSPHRPFDLRARHGAFLGRQDELERLVNTLNSNWPVCLITGLGGVGKTTIALETAYACAGQPRGIAAELIWPTFAYIIWTSGEDGRLSLNDLLDAIAHRLGYPRLTKQTLNDKQHDVREILSAQTVLLIIDNFETVDDPTIPDFIVRLPPSVKVLLTSREEESLLAPVFRHFPPAPIHVGGLPTTEALIFLRQEARRLADLSRERERERLEAVVSSSDATLLTLVKATDGNPKALALALGYIKDSAAPLETLVHNLYAAHDSLARLFDYFFSQAWERCSEEARALWRVVSFFADAVGREALAATANLPGRYFYDALEQLRDRSLLDIEEGPNKEPRYRAHPMVRAYAVAQFREAPDLEANARRAWVDYYDRYLTEHSFDDWPTFAVLDHEYENLLAAILWALEHSHPSAPRMARHFWRYLYVRGHWRQTELVLSQALDQVTASGEFLSRLWFKSSVAWILVERGQYAEARQHLQQVEAEAVNLDSRDLLAVRNVFNSLGQAYLGLNDLKQAEIYEQHFLELAEQANDPHDILVARYYLAWIKACSGFLGDAAPIFQHLVAEAQAIQWNRAEGYCIHKLILTQIHRGYLNEAEQWLSRVADKSTYWQEPLLQAHILLDQAQLSLARRSPDSDNKARQLGLAALDLYQRLGAETQIKNAKTFMDEFRLPPPSALYTF